MKEWDENRNSQAESKDEPVKFYSGDSAKDRVCVFRNPRPGQGGVGGGCAGSEERRDAAAGGNIHLCVGESGGVVAANTTRQSVG